MKTLQVGIDIDGVLALYVRGFLNYYNNKNGTTFTPGDVTGRIASTLQCSFDEYINIAHEFMGKNEFSSIEPMKYSRMILKMLSEKYDLHIITARSDRFESVTRQWLFEHYGKSFHSVNFCNFYGGSTEKRIKSQIMKELGIDVLIEDEMENILDVSGSGIPVIAIRAPWNKEVYQSFLVNPVNSWAEVPRILEGIELFREKVFRDKELIES
jgi:uncharacterized HAD superfamily protein